MCSYIPLMPQDFTVVVTGPRGTVTPPRPDNAVSCALVRAVVAERPSEGRHERLPPFKWTTGTGRQMRTARLHHCAQGTWYAPGAP